MARRFIVLAGSREAPYLAQHFRSINPTAIVRVAHGLVDLEVAIAASGPETRLISFLTDVIVPAGLINRLIPEPYNVHPGPPDYPGAHPVCFAIWDQAQRYGATAHVMTAQVDTGPIVLTEYFSVPPGIFRRDLGDLAFAASVQLFAALAAHCATSDAPMRRSGEHWRGRARTRREFEALLARRADLSPESAARLDRAWQDAAPGRARESAKKSQYTPAGFPANP